METITSYIDNLFKGYPDTPQVRRAKEELLGIMEDKYHELKTEGKSEHEAIGIVISEFGSMDEISFELGFAEKKEEAPRKEQDFSEEAHLSSEDAAQYLKAQEQFGTRIGFGVALCILSPSVSALMEALYEGGFLAEKISDSLGAIALFSMVAVAVGIFIVSGISQSKYESYKSAYIRLDRSTKALLAKQQEAFRPIFGMKIAAGVILCIVSIIPVITMEAIFEDSALEWVNELSAISLFVFVAAAVFLFITAGTKQGAYDTLLGKTNRAAYAAAKKKDKKISIIASIYWPVITAIYLGVSFVTFNWGFTWIIWPIAGILFGSISAVITLISKE